MGKCCLHISSFIFDRIIIKVAVNQDRHKSSDEFDFGPLVSMYHLYVFWNEIWPWHIGLRWAIVAFWATWSSSVEFDFGLNQTAHFGVTCPWVTKISHFWTLISLEPVGQSWSNFTCSIIGVGERLHKVLGQIGSKLWFPWQQKAPIDL